MRIIRSIAAAAVIVAWLAGPTAVAAHPLGNFTVNRAAIVEIGGDVRIGYMVDMAEIPAFEAIGDIDADGDGTPRPAEESTWARATCDAARSALRISLDGAAAPLVDAAAPVLAFPPGAGGLPTLRLECSFALASGPDAADEHRFDLTDTTADERIGWREVIARVSGSAVLLASDVPRESSTDELRRYPEAMLQSPPDTRSARIVFRLDPGGAEPMPADPSPTRAEAPVAPGDPLAALVGGELTPAAVILAMAAAIGLGAAHALSPGHGKTLVAAYVLGAGADGRSALRVGLWVAVSHTAGVFGLGVLTLAASEFLLPERAIAWLSLASAATVTVLGLVLVARRWPRRGGFGGHHHDHPHGHPHPHGHALPTGRSAAALGFAGGLVPSASAVIVLLVAISSDRLAFGGLLIAMFGVGMAVVLGGLGLAVVHARALVQRTGFAAAGGPRLRRIMPWIPVGAGLAVLATGLFFGATAALRLG